MTDIFMANSPEFPSPSLLISNKSLPIGTNFKLKIADVKSFLKNNFPVSLSESSPAAIEHSFNFLKYYIDQRIPIYGVNTQFGDQVGLLDPHLSLEYSEDSYYKSIQARQQRLIRSHSCAMGAKLPPDIIRTALLLRTHCLAQGYSGVSLNAIQTMIEFLNSGITPVVNCYGSIGASGDLIPLAMIAAAITGEEVNVVYQGKEMRAYTALQLAGLQPLRPIFRDGLAMINGTSFMTAIACIALSNLQRTFRQMLITIAMVLESMLVIDSAYQPIVHELKGHKGEIAVNNFLLNFWEGSELVVNLDELRMSKKSANATTKSVQDYYSVRSVAQGFGPFQENLHRASIWIENEMNSINDNPIIDVASKRIHHSANFMGYYVTDTCDILKMNIAQASTWLHALLANMVHPRKNCQLPANLVQHPEKDNGFRPLQLLAAALAVQNRKFAQGHQAYMLPTEGDNQDVNSLGTHAALDLREAIANLDRLTAILLLAAVQALELRGIDKASRSSQNIYYKVRAEIKTIADCRPLTEELENMVLFLQNENI